MIKILFHRSTHIFWLLVFANLVASFFNFSGLFFITKPLLMPALALTLFNIKNSSKKIIVAGLFFSWLGDIFLLFDQYNELFFITGLVSFLITHACYIIYFLSLSSPAPSLLKRQPFFILIVVCYGGWLVWLLFPYLGQLKIPVMVYAVIICSMMLCSIHIYLKVKSPANKHYVLGAALFVLSDSILAINKFYRPLPIAGTLVMLTYCGAQYFIVLGFLKKIYADRVVVIL